MEKKNILEELKRMSQKDLEKPIIARMNVDNNNVITGKELKEALEKKK